MTVQMATIGKNRSMIRVVTYSYVVDLGFRMAGNGCKIQRAEEKSPALY